MNIWPPSRVAIAKFILSFLVVTLWIGMPVSARANSITINPTFSGMNGGLSLSAQTIIDNAINFYEAILTDPITVNIEFYNMRSGLGSSFFVFYTEPYTTYRSALVADQSSADDATALASLPPTAPIATTLGFPGRSVMAFIAIEKSEPHPS